MGSCQCCDTSTPEQRHLLADDHQQRQRQRQRRHTSPSLHSTFDSGYHTLDEDQVIRSRSRLQSRSSTPNLSDLGVRLDVDDGDLMYGDTRGQGRVEQRQVHGGVERDSSESGISRTSSSKAESLFKQHFRVAVGQLPGATVASLSQLFQRATKRTDLAGSISRETFKSEFAMYFDEIGQSMGDQLFDAMAEDGTCQFEHLVSALYVWGAGSMRDKATLLFDLFDNHPRNGTLNVEEIKQLVLCVSKGAIASTVIILKAIGLQVDDNDAADADADSHVPEHVHTASDIMLHADELDDYLPVLLSRIDADFDGQVTLADWHAFCAESPTLRAFLDHFCLPTDNLS